MDHVIIGTLFSTGDRRGNDDARTLLYCTSRNPLFRAEQGTPRVDGVDGLHIPSILLVLVNQASEGRAARCRAPENVSSSGKCCR